MLKLYIYDKADKEVVVIVEGPTNEACEREADSIVAGHWEYYGATYNPAFGTNDGLILPEGETP